MFLNCCQCLTNVTIMTGILPGHPGYKFSFPAKSYRMQCRKYQTNRAVLLEMPLVLLRSFLTPSSGIFMKWYLLNQLISFAEKCNAIARIVSHGILLALVGWLFEATISVGAFFSLASEVSTQLDGQILWKNIGWIDVGVLEVGHSHFLPIFCRAINFATFLCLFCLLTTGGVATFRSFGSSRIVLISTTLLRRGSYGFHICVICSGCTSFGWATLLIIPSADSGN